MRTGVTSKNALSAHVSVYTGGITGTHSGVMRVHHLPPRVVCMYERQVPLPQPACDYVYRVFFTK